MTLIMRAMKFHLKLALNTFTTDMKFNYILDIEILSNNNAQKRRVLINYNGKINENDIKKNWCMKISMLDYLRIYK